jgi:CubicO group peptidase (beta-lactamase class C family)
MYEHQELEKLFDVFFSERMKTYGIPGAALVIVKDEELIFSQGYGYADLKKEIPVICDRTLFRVGSVSKLFTTVAVMQLAERGKLKLDDDINQYLKDFQIPDTYPNPITFANLLTHTDGFDFGWGIGIFDRSSSNLVSLGDFLHKFRDVTRCVMATRNCC